MNESAAATSSPRIAEHLLDMIPESVRHMPDCIARVSAIAAALGLLADAITGFDGAPESAGRLKYAAAAYFEVLMQTVEWAVALQVAENEAKGATTH